MCTSNPVSSGNFLKASALEQSFMATEDNASSLSFFFFGVIIKFPNDRDNIKEGDWTLSGIEVQKSKTSITKLILFKRFTFPSQNDPMGKTESYTLLYMTAAIIQFNVKPGADH